MKIYFIERDAEKLGYMKDCFKGTGVTFVRGTLERFLSEREVECIVSPANSFGLMDGGYDFYITAWFGEQLQDRVQKYIIKNYLGEQPVGTSFIIDANDKGQKLIHTPTMQIPGEIKDDLVVYQCMRSTLACAKKHKVKSILIPMFGCGVGGVHPQRVAQLMRQAYDQINNPPKSLDWEYAFSVEVK